MRVEFLIDSDHIKHMLKNNLISAVATINSKPSYPLVICYMAIEAMAHLVR